MSVQVTAYAGAREALGSRTVEVPAGSVAQICASLVNGVEADRQARLRAVLDISSVLVAGQSLRSTDDFVVPDGAQIDLLPPFAGG